MMLIPFLKKTFTRFSCLAIKLQFALLLPLVHKGLNLTLHKFPDSLADLFVRLAKVFLKSAHIRLTVKYGYNYRLTTAK